MVAPMPLGRPSTALVLVALAVASAACGASSRLVPEKGFHHDLGREHPLVGRVWDGSRFLSADELVSRVRAAPVLLLGESHDHVDHHRLQARLLAAWLDAHPEGAVAFEMLDEDQAPALAGGIRDPDAFARAVGWERSGWPPFALYRPIFEVLAAEGAPPVAAHPSRARVRASMMGMAPELRRELMLEPWPLSDALDADLAEEIRAAHCGHASGGMLRGMVRAQVLKDAFMARAMADVGGPVALVSGRGHVRTDRGVPLHLRARGVEGVLSVAFVEVAPGAPDPAAYEPGIYDVVVFTPRVSDQSACDRFREQLEKMRAHGETGG